MSAIPQFTKRLEARIALALAKAEAALAGITSVQHHTASTNGSAVGPAGTIVYSAPSFTPRTGKVRITAIAFVSGGTLTATHQVTSVLLQDGVQVVGAPIALASSTAASDTLSVALEWEVTVTPNTAHVWALQSTVSDGSGQTIEYPIGGGSAGGAAAIILQELP